MLAGRLTDINQIRYPVLCTPKLDGIRCLVVDGHAVSRTFKNIPNRYVFGLVSKLDNGLDGELMCDGATFSEITGNMMR